ncbi:unnamed protein product [Blepharisma stoltei]|uniref:Uncharacterized protein n=1 Tax=Blepharisma stoltei TaxID=1481888 RepID=A0AAU9K4B9_9CILI|nr:unnamed protein product [Blepharisma stoltei]
MRYLLNLLSRDSISSIYFKPTRCIYFGLALKEAGFGYLSFKAFLNSGEMLRSVRLFNGSNLHRLGCFFLVNSMS